jgi:hypothetical protein
MATCENCNKGGYTAEQMDNRWDKVVGPCCYHIYAPQMAQVTGGQVNAPPPEYGVEVSNKIGIRAYVEYAGFKAEFKKSPEEIKQLFEEKK